ncbi:MAG: LCP family protein [Eubacteriaceae bacterium]|nr:LCP family protein [Eubacteriaceae bacterium]
MKNTFDKTRVNGNGEKLNKETIRKYEDPEFKKAAEEYERMARNGNGNGGGSHARTPKPKPQKSYDPNRKKSLRRAEADEAKRYGRSGQNGAAGMHAGKPAGNPYGGDNNAYDNNRNAYAGGYDNSGGDGFGSGGGNNGGGGGGAYPRKRKRRLNPKKVIRNIIIILLVLFAAFVVYFLSITSHLDKVDTDKSEFAIDSQVASDLKGYRNIAILGVDARKGESLDGSRTDAIIIMRIKKSNGDMQLISIMRDSYLKMADTDGKLILDKITHAHHYGGGVDTCAALNRSMDLNIKEFVIFNWQAVADTVDTLGGIEVDVKKNEIRDLNKWGPETAENVGGTYTKITKTGKQTIDGVQATTYCRIRKTSGGDTGRGNRYKKVMSAVMKKAVTSPGKMNDLATKVLPEIRTNMSQMQLLSAVLRSPGYSIDKSYGWPKKYYGGLLGNGIWYAVPKTLESNVSWLHKKAFDQDDYTPSDTCSEISNEIMYYTGIQ